MSVDCGTAFAWSDPFRDGRRSSARENSSPGVGVAHALQKRHEHLARLVGKRCREHAFLGTLANDLRQQWPALRSERFVHSPANDGVAVGVPDTRRFDHLPLVGQAQPVERGKRALQLLDRRQLGIADDGQKRLC